jgi:hypothetical protein
MDASGSGGGGAGAPLSLTEAAATGAPCQPGLDLPEGDRVVGCMDVVVASAADAVGGKCVGRGLSSGGGQAGVIVLPSVC